MTTPTHRLTSDRRGDDEPEFRPRCSCGWACPGWVSRAVAERLGDDHLAEVTEPRVMERAS